MRLITDNHVSAGFGLAGDEYMARQVGLRASAPTLRLYSYRSHCALVGRHQSIDAEINRAYCEANGIALNRRPTGGGAIIMGDDQLGVALTIPLDAASGAPHRLRELFAQFSRGILAGLALLNVQAAFGGKNDIEIGRKKIAGLGVYHDKSGGLLFHCSLLVDLDIALMLRILKTPFEKISDKAIATVAHRVSTVRRELNQPISFDTVREAIGKGIASEFGATLTPSAFSAAEVEGIRALEESKYLTREWIEQKTLAGDSMGSARVKTPGGLLNVELTLAGDVVKAIYITGDFLADAEQVSALESALRWRAARPDAIAASVSDFYAGAPYAFEQIAPEDFTRAITRAIENAEKKLAAGEPYGCFVNPGGIAHAETPHPQPLSPGERGV